jgi:hypothetical protein
VGVRTPRELSRTKKAGNSGNKTQVVVLSQNSCALGIDHVDSVRARLEEFSVLRGPCIKRSCI